MWIATKVGFFSIVKKKEDEFHVRARMRSDLVELMKLSEIESELFESDHTDYRFRLVVDRKTVELIGTKLFAEIDYSNFKNRVSESPTQRDKSDAYGDIWATMWGIQEGDSIL
jgi:hypothetical protein